MLPGPPPICVPARLKSPNPAAAKALCFFSSSCYYPNLLPTGGLLFYRGGLPDGFPPFLKAAMRFDPDAAAAAA